MLRYNKEFSKGGTELNLLKIGMTGLMLGGLLTGCGTEETSKPKEEVEVNSSVEEINMNAAEEVDPKEWKIVTPPPEILEYENANVWVAAKVKEFSQVSNPKMYEAGFDDGYDYYLKAQNVTNVLDAVRFTIEGVDIQKDFENLRVIVGTIGHLHYARTAHLDPEGTGKVNFSPKEWKPADERMKTTYDYMLQLLNDLDVALNKNGEGETFGVTHQLDGDRVDEMESFLKGAY